jgi:hypothetical protein
MTSQNSQDLHARLQGLIAGQGAPDSVLNVDYDLGAGFTCQAIMQAHWLASLGG